MVPQEVEAILCEAKAGFIFAVITTDLRLRPLELGGHVREVVIVPKTKSAQGLGHLLQMAVTVWVVHDVARVPA